MVVHGSPAKELPGQAQRGQAEIWKTEKMGKAQT
jgi:hypothetical protein